MRLTGAVVALIVVAGAQAGAREGSFAILRPADKLEWAADPGVKGADRARLIGDGTRPRERNVLMRRWPAGTYVASHRHSGRNCDGVVIEGTVTVTSGCGKSEELMPGSYFFIAGRAVHSFRCSSQESCLLFMSEPNSTEPVKEDCSPTGDPKSPTAITPAVPTDDAGRSTPR